MALPSAVCTVASGSAAAVSANNAVVVVNCGDVITVALNSTSGVQSWTLRTKFSDDPLLMGIQFTSTTQTSLTFQAPNQPFLLTLDSEVTDYFNSYTSAVVIQGGKPITQVGHVARVATAAALAAYTASGGVLTANANGALAAVDGVTLVAGDRLLLVTGAAGADNGLYVVTSAGGASAKYVLTRAPDWATGSTLLPATVVEVGPEGTLFANTSWKVTTALPVTVDTTSVALFPGRVTQSVTLVTGFVTKTNVPILSTTTTAGIFMPTNFSGASTTVSYRNGAYASGGAATVAGAIGTGSISVTALVAAGTFNTNDVGTGTLTIINW
jgi:hypothetical protein